MPITITGATLSGVTFNPTAVTTDPYFMYVPLLLNTTSTNAQQNNTFLDSSTNNFTITRNGTPTQGAFTPYQPSGYWSGYFDGASDYLAVPANAAFDFGTGDFTIECWFFLTADAATNAGGIKASNLFSTVPTSGAVNGYAFYLNGNSTTTGISLVFENDISSVPYSVTYTFTFAKNTWYHAAVARSGTVTKLFVNGAQVASATLGNQSVTSFANVPTIASGLYSGYTNKFPGYISNFRMIKKFILVLNFDRKIINLILFFLFYFCYYLF